MQIKVETIREYKDGSCDIEVSYNKYFIEFVKKHYKRKRISKKLIQRAVVDGLTNYIKLVEGVK